MPPKTQKSSAPWFNRPMRIGALQCNFEGGQKQTLAVSDQWRKMGVNVEQLFHPCADSYSSLFDERRHGRLLRSYLERARRNGMRVILYLNVHIIGPSDASRFKEWAQCQGNGDYPRLYGTFYACCMNSAWRTHLFQTLKSLSHYDIDGIFLDGPTMISDGCHCPACQAQFRAWFGRPMGNGPSGAEFIRRTQAEFLTEVYREFKRVKPDGIVYQNLPAGNPTASHLDISATLAVNDIVGTEGGFMFYGPARDSFLWRPGVEARLLEALAPAKSRVIFMAADQKSWSWYMHTAAETALCMATIAANGANIWYGLHGPTRLLATPGGQAAKRLFRFMERNEAVYTNTRSSAKLALLYSYTTEKAWSFPTQQSDFYGKGQQAHAGVGNPWEALNGFADFITRSHVPYDLVCDLNLSAESLAGYDAVILASVGCMTSATAQILREFVRRGGSLLATFNSSLYDEQGFQRPNFDLADVLGIKSLNQVTSYENFNYLVPQQAHRLFAGITTPYWQAPKDALNVRVKRGTHVLARFMHPWPGRYMPNPKLGFPAITLSRFGKGECLYLAGTTGEFCDSYAPLEYRQIIGNWLADSVHSTATLEGDRSPVEVTVRSQGQRLIIHLVNHCSFSARPFERMEPVHNLTLKIRRKGTIGQVRALALKKSLTPHPSRGGYVVHLPVLRDYEVIVVD
jgi:hypothetical protein